MPSVICWQCGRVTGTASEKAKVLCSRCRGKFDEQRDRKTISIPGMDPGKRRLGSA